MSQTFAGPGYHDPDDEFEYYLSQQAKGKEPKMTILSKYDKIQLQLTLLTYEAENDREAIARNLLTEQEAQARAELRGIQRQNISWWLRSTTSVTFVAKNGGEDEDSK